MSCRKKCGTCNDCTDTPNGQSGPRGFRGLPGPVGPIGPTGPCCTGPTGPGETIVPTHSPIQKPLAATFYGIGAGTVGPGDVFDFPLDGPNDPIGRAGSGTFILPFAGLYKVSWQMPIVEGAVIPFGPTLGPVDVQSTLTAQTVEEGSFVPVAGGVVGKGSPLSQLVGETIVEATRNNYPIRIENTSVGPTGPAPVNYYAGPPANPNHRTINIASLVPQRIDAIGAIENNSPQTVAPNANVTFDTGCGFPVPPAPQAPNGGIGATGATGPAGCSGTYAVNVGVTPGSPPYTGLVVQKAAQYVIEWDTKQARTEPANGGLGGGYFAPYVNGMPIPNSTISINAGSGRLATNVVLNVGDVVTLRNLSGIPIELSNTRFPNAYLAIYSYS